MANLLPKVRHKQFQWWSLHRAYEEKVLTSPSTIDSWPEMDSQTALLGTSWLFWKKNSTFFEIFLPCFRRLRIEIPGETWVSNWQSWPFHEILLSILSSEEFSISRMTSSPSLLIWLSFYSNLVMFLMHWSYNAIWPQALKKYLHYLSLIWWLHYFCWVPMLREREPARCIRPTPGIRTRTLTSTKWHHRVVKQCGFEHPNNFHPSVGGILNKESKNSW